MSIESELEQLRSNSPSSTLVSFSDVQLQQIAVNRKADLLEGDRPKAKRVLQGLIAKVVAEKEGGKVFYTLPLLKKTGIDKVPPRGTAIYASPPQVIKWKPVRRGRAKTVD